MNSFCHFDVLVISPVLFFIFFVLVISYEILGLKIVVLVYIPVKIVRRSNFTLMSIYNCKDF